MSDNLLEIGREDELEKMVPKKRIRKRDEDEIKK